MLKFSRPTQNCVAGSGQVPATFRFNRCGQNIYGVPNPVGITLGTITRIATHPANDKLALCLILLCKNRKDFNDPGSGANWNDIMVSDGHFKHYRIS